MYSKKGKNTALYGITPLFTSFTNMVLDPLYFNQKLLRLTKIALFCQH